MTDRRHLDAGTGARLLSPRRLAAALDVSESSLKRWIDEGRLRASRTAGGHRRVELAEAIRYVREARIPVAHPHLLDDALGLAPGQERLESGVLREALARPDQPRVKALLVGSFMRGQSLAALVDGPVRSALAEIGESWKRGPLGIVEEHGASEALASAFVELQALLPEPGAGAPLAIGGGPSGDPHSLPSLFAAAVLCEAGYRTLNLGPDVPVEAGVAALELHRPGLAWISFSAPVSRSRYEEATRPLAEAAARVGSRLIAGGRGAAGVASPAVPGVTWANTMTDLARIAAKAGRTTTSG